MSNDVNVQAYFTLVADQIKQVLVPYSKDLLKPDRVKPTKATFEAAAQNLVATHLDETKYLMELGLKIRKRYELANKSESEVRNLFDKVLDALNKNPKNMPCPEEIPVIRLPLLAVSILMQIITSHRKRLLVWSII